jgi:hypothetical protein
MHRRLVNVQARAWMRSGLAALCILLPGKRNSNAGTDAVFHSNSDADAGLGGVPDWPARAQSA